MKENIISATVWGGNINGANRRFKSIGWARRWINQYIEKCHKEFGLSCGDVFGEIDIYQTKPFRHIYHEEID